MNKCPKCGNQVQDDAIFCDQCGARLKPVEAPTEAAVEESAPATAQAPQGIVCPSCGTVNTPGEMFCDNCGAPLAAPQPEPEAVAAVQAPTQEAAVAAEPLSPQQPAEAPPAPAATPLRECPSCGARVGPNDTFCEFCGAALVSPAEGEPTAPAPTPPPAPQAVPQAAPAGPRLIIVASGVEVPLPAGKQVLVGREDPYSGVYPEVDLTPHGGEDAGVSRRHCKLAPSGAQYTIEDLNSTNFTFVNRKRLQAGAPVTIGDGDEIRVGNLKMIFRVD